MTKPKTTVKLTKRVVDALTPDDGPWVYDSELTGFALRIYPSWIKTYCAKYRFGRGRAGINQTFKIGRHGQVTPDQARQVAKRVLADVARGLNPAADRSAEKAAHTVGDMIDLFVTDVAKTKSEKTVEQYRHVLLRTAKPAFGKRKAAQLSLGEIAKLHREMSDRPFQANRVVGVISAMYGWAAKRHLVPRGCNPAADVERYKEEGRERFLSDEELQRLGAALSASSQFGPYPTAAIRLLILTGARLREILGLKWTEVDLARGLLLLSKSKTGKKAIVLNAPALQILTELPRSGTFVVAGNDPDRPRADLNKPWSTIRKAAGLEDLRLHDLRHSHASVGAGLGLSLPIIGSLLGHTQAATTQRYSHLANDPVRQASERIGAEIAAGLGLQTPANDADAHELPKNQ